MSKPIPLFLISSFLIMTSCESGKMDNFPWEEHGKLLVNEGKTYIQHEDGTPFLWLGCTSWGMTEWMSREEVSLYLDDRKSKGMNVVQLCLFWGKRRDYPTRFTANEPNHYGHKAFTEKDGKPDPAQPALSEGGSSENPNDYWDHVDFCLDAIKQRGMYAAVLPFWGRRYVNASHSNQSLKVFTIENIFKYGSFLGERYRNEPHIIWVNGGDVKAVLQGDFIPHYRSLAEGLANGVTGQSVSWNEESAAWDQLLMTYHPDGSPMVNSSQWFHDDVWLDFNMIETHINRNKVVASIRQDLEKMPIKPTVLGEGHYEGYSNQGDTVTAIHIRRQAWQTFFAGAAGHTYGGYFGKDGSGPLFSASNNWQPLLDWEGAGQLIHLRNFLQENNWHLWIISQEVIRDHRGAGELEKLAVSLDNSIFVYFPENAACSIRLDISDKTINWYNPATGQLENGDGLDPQNCKPPYSFQDAVLIVK